MTRPTSCTRYLKRTFSQPELVEMGRQLASSHSQLATIKTEKAAAVAQFSMKEKQLAVEVERISGLIAAGFDMQNVRCIIAYDEPNVNEVTIRREDTREVIETRPFNAEERQTELPLTDREGEIAVIPPEKPEAEAEQVIEESQAAVDQFFGQVMCQDCEKNFPASAIIKTSDDLSVCPDCFKKQGPAAESEAVEMVIPETGEDTVEMNF
jgi:hypothetical protein